MASKSSNSVTTVYQCSECDHCSQNLEEATLHAVQEHGDEEENDEIQEESEEESYPKIQIKNDKDLISSDEEYSSSSVYKQTNGTYEGQGNLRRTDQWSHESTKTLLEAVTEHYTDLKSKTVKKKPIWETIKNSLENQMSNLTASKCEQRWRGLVTSYKKYLASYGKPYGKVKPKKPEYFNELCDIVGTDNVSNMTIPSDAGVVTPSPSFNTSTNRTTKGGKKKDSLSLQLQSLLQDESSAGSTAGFIPGSTAGAGVLGGSAGNDAILVLGNLVSILERREAANERFQREVLEMEREKLRCIQRFVEGREKVNAKRMMLIKDMILSQSKAKRRRSVEED